MLLRATGWTKVGTGIHTGNCHGRGLDGWNGEKGKRMLEKGEKGTVQCTVEKNLQHTVCNVSTVVYLHGTVLYCTVGTMRRTVYSIHRER